MAALQRQREGGRGDGLPDGVVAGDLVGEHRAGSGGRHLEVGHPHAGAEGVGHSEVDEAHVVVGEPRKDRTAPDCGPRIVGVPLEPARDARQFGKIERDAGAGDAPGERKARHDRGRGRAEAPRVRDPVVAGQRKARTLDAPRVETVLQRGDDQVARVERDGPLALARHGDAQVARIVKEFQFQVVVQIERDADAVEPGADVRRGGGHPDAEPPPHVRSPRRASRARWTRRSRPRSAPRSPC